MYMVYKKSYVSAYHKWKVEVKEMILLRDMILQFLKNVFAMTI